MNRNISKLIVAFMAVLFAWTTTIAQEAKTMYLMKQGVVVYQSAIAEIDSVIFYSPAPAVVPVTGVSLNKNSTSLTTGGTEQLTATVAPSDATNKSVTWSSNATGVATVSTSGLITAVAAGTATITVTTQDGNKTATCAVTVTQPSTNLTVTASPAATFKLSDCNNSGSHTVLVTYNGTSVFRQDCDFTSSNAAVADVSAYGTIRAYTTGTAVITVTLARYTNGTPTTIPIGTKGTITLTVTDGGSVGGATFNLVIGEGQNAPYTPLVTGPVAAGKTVYLGIDNNGTWVSRSESTLTSSNTGVATISSSGAITTITNGTTVIKAVHPTGSGEITLTVGGGSDPVVPAAKVTSTCYVDRAAGFKGTFSNTAIVNGKVELTGTNTSGTYTSVEFATVQFTKLVGSWSVSHVNVSGSTVEVEFRVKNTAGTWSSWLSYRQWGFKRGSNTSCTVTDTGNSRVNASGGVASITEDEISGGTYSTFQYRVTLRRSSGSTASPKIKAISATLLRTSGDTFSAPSAAKTWPITGSNILVQQNVPSIGGSICSPTCVTMLMVHKGITDFGGCTYKHEYTARKIVYDGYIYGNWAFCTSAMGSWGTTDYVAYARHIYSSNEIAQLLTKGPIAASIQGNSTAGALVDTNGRTQYSGAGHLIVVRGFEMSGGAVSAFLISDPNNGQGSPSPHDYKVTPANLLKCIVSKIVYVLE